jgi:hypothetical protein
VAAAGQQPDQDGRRWSRAGHAVALTNGATLAAGGNADNKGIGATWVFTRNAGGGLMQQGMVGTRRCWGVCARLCGCSVCRWGPLAAGSSEDSSYTGTTWVFTRSAGGQWMQQGNLSGAGQLVPAVRKNVCGSLWRRALAVGAPYDADWLGAVWVFRARGDGGSRRVASWWAAGRLGRSANQMHGGTVC